MHLKPALHFSAATLVKLAVGLLVVKFLAWRLGPEAFGLLGQLMSIVAIASMFAGGGAGNGLIKLLAETRTRPRLHARWISAAFTLGATTSVLIALVLIALSNSLSALLLDGYDSRIFVCLAFAQIVIGAGNLVLAELSSRNDSCAYAFVNIVGSVVGAAMLIIAVTTLGYDGAAYAVVGMPTMIGIAAIVLFLRQRPEVLRHCRLVPDRAGIRRLLRYSAVTLAGATALPLAQVAARDALGARIGWAEVGYWQGVLKISDVYMQFVGVILINYALPRLSAAGTRSVALREYRRVLGALVVTLVIGFVAIYGLRDWIVRLLFAESFAPMSELFGLQMMGDLFRTIAAATSYFFLARGVVRVAFLYELMQGVGFLLVFFALPLSAGRMAPLYAHVATYLALAVCMTAGLAFWSRKFR